MHILYNMHKNVSLGMAIANIFKKTNLSSYNYNQYKNWSKLSIAIIQSIAKSRNLKLLAKTVGMAVSGSVLFSNVNTNPFLLQALAKSKSDMIKVADELYDQLKFEEIYDLLIVEKDSKDDEILWRLARATYEKARKTNKIEDKKVLYANALSYLEIANESNSENFAVHKWLAIIKDAYFSLEGIKARISHLYDMKTHMEKACSLKPQDGTSWYVLGLWYYGIANISWYERKAASLFFATPPQASYEDALKIFLEAERVEPDFYSKNHLIIGKCLYYIGRKEEAKKYLLKAKNCLGKTQDDEESRIEADKWLKAL